MATKIFRINSAIDSKNFSKSFVKGIAKPIANAMPYFKVLGQLIDRDTQMQFRSQGGRSGSDKWPIFKTKVGIKRPGTDGSKTRRRTPADQLLQASGLFRKSFRVTRVSKTGVKYQTVHRLGGKIGSNPRREVLVVTANDITKYQKQFKTFIDKGIVF